jgi:hypothetical protein
VAVFWLHPLALLGLVALIVPILIHLLVRHKSRRLLFPSIRFLRQTTSVSLRRQFISNWPLLVTRLLVLTCAVAAVAGPTVVTDARRATWNRRVARAIIDGSQATKNTTARKDPIVEAERASSFASAVFASSNGVPGAVRDAVMWLNRLPPAAREIVIVGDLRRGSLTARDIDAIPRHIGIRFQMPPNEATTPTVDLMAVGERAAGTASMSQIRVTLAEGRTSATYEPAPAFSVPIEVLAARAHQQHAQAVLGAVLAEGVVLGRQIDRRLTIAFAGAEEVPIDRLTQPASAGWMREALERLPGLRGGEVGDRFVVRTDVPVTDGSAAALVARIARVVFADDLGELEPRRIPAATLEAWSRAPLPSLTPVPPTDEGDRRWLWGAVLVLLGIEQLVRRGRTVVRPSIADPAAADGEVRVA